MTFVNHSMHVLQLTGQIDFAHSRALFAARLKSNWQHPLRRLVELVWNLGFSGDDQRETRNAF